MTFDFVRRPPWGAVLVFALLGAALAGQINSQRSRAPGGAADEARLQQVLTLYLAEKQQTQQLRQQLTQAAQTLEAEQREAAGRGLQAASGELDAARQGAGLVAMEGPGIRVVLRDASEQTEGSPAQSAYTVHDQDLLLVANELWSAQAEAVSVNGQRLAIGSAIRCSGPVIEVNKRPLAAPYEVLAIGDAEALKGALEGLRGGIVDQLRSAGIEVKVTKEKDQVVPAFARLPGYRYARPALVGAAPPGNGG